MEEKIDREPQKITKTFKVPANLNKIVLGVLLVSLVLGTGSGYILANKKADVANESPSTEQAKSPQQDNRTFRDFAEGVIRVKPEPKDPSVYSEGTHLLERTGAPSVALTSSVVDLSQYEGKKVKVYGETQKAVKEGWLMDVGKVETVQ